MTEMNAISPRQRRGFHKSLLCVALIGSCCILGSVWHPGTAQADPMSECSTTTGEIVVVDFAPWGGDIER
ncbi:MAG: hypothetical protein WAM97_01740, partial [Acidimicrobiales bacterium]